MAPRKKKTKKKNNAGCSAPPSSTPAHVHASHPPPPPQVVTSSPPPPNPPEPSAPPSQHSIAIMYPEGELCWQFNCIDLNCRARTAVEQAIALGIANVCQATGLSRENLVAMASCFPPSIGERHFSVTEWFTFGKQPYITICSMPTGHRDEVREKFQQVLSINKNLMMRNGLSSLRIAKGECEECSGCTELRASTEALQARLIEVKHEEEVLLQERDAILVKFAEDLGRSVNYMEKVMAEMIEQMQVIDTRMSRIFGDFI